MVYTAAMTLNNFKPKEKQSFLKCMETNLKRFPIETALNGLKYINDKERNMWERGYYLLSFVVNFLMGIYMTIYFLNKWKSTPVIISVNSETTSITDIPFPSVTFCNMNQAIRSRVKDFSENSPEYALLQKICFRKFNFTGYSNFKPRCEGDTLGKFITKNSQSCSEMFVFCKFGPNEENCTDLFREILLDEGLCCVFNQVHPLFLFKGEHKLIRDYTSSNGSTIIPIKWTFEDGYVKPLPKQFYPRPALGLGVSMGLTVVLNANQDEYFCSSTNGAGFKMLLYNPIDLPHIKEAGLPIELGQQTRVRLNTRIMSAAPTLREVSPKERQCYFSDEKQLLFYKYYTRRNCELECDTQLILRLCNCIPFNMPMIVENSSVCFLQHMSCLDMANHLLDDEQTKACKRECLTGCHDLLYYPDFFKASFIKRRYQVQDPFFANFSEEMMQHDLAQVSIYYKYNFVRGHIKAPYTGLTEFLSQTGGVLGLMIGFSVMCLAEIFYFGFLKSFIDVYLRRPPQKLSPTDDGVGGDGKSINMQEVGPISAGLQSAKHLYAFSVRS
uniref:Pickpocket protein 28-like n=1 Tax=Stomoxys calcitrans TaxID=35570 RepID=A0A1I8NPJ0_STOCA